MNKTSRMVKNVSTSSYEFPVIGRVHSCYKEKFGIPRQSGLVPCARAQIEMIAPYNVAAAFVGLEQSSHIWIQFVFHENLQHHWRPKVRPPRLGGNRSLGVFATRSPVRPSALGLSVVELERVDTSSGVTLHILGADLLEGTPVIDIKPYIPYADCIPSACNGIAENAPSVLPVQFSSKASRFVQALPEGEYFLKLIEQVLQQNPRPQYQKIDSERIYGTRISNFDVRWCYLETQQGEVVQVLDIEDL